MTHQTLLPKDPKVRPLPFPFRGAVSISSDAEYLEFEFFETLMKFLNSTSDTILGKGLGLEVTSSMFFYSVDKRTFSYFDGGEATAAENSYSPRLDQYIKAGWIDTNHSYGDFFLSNKFTREHAIRSFEVIRRLSTPLFVFTNHGGNSSNFGAHSSLYRGDIKDDINYNSDLLIANKTRYVWLDKGPNMIERQDLLGIVKYCVKEVIGYHNRNYSLGERRLLKRCSLRDGSEFIGFVRLRSTGRYGPDISSLGRQLHQINWSRLYKENGVSVIYQHLGVMSQNSSICVSSSVEDIAKRKEVFLAPFYFLRHENEMGRLWVVGTAKLLIYADVIESAILHFDKQRNCYEVKLDLDMPIEPQRLLAGLTFYIDPTKPVNLVYKGQQIKTTYNGADETGQYSATVPLQPLENIWK